jgi:hypothetical protein
MKITCSVEKGGCGEKFTVTPELLTEYKQYAESGVSSGCPNSTCERLLTAEELHKLVTLVEKRREARKPQFKVLQGDPWPGFPLKTPITPEGRRKNGAKPGVSFKKIGEGEMDRPPTPTEVLRVQQEFAAGLDDGTDCPCCTRHARRQHRAFGCGPARWLIELIYLSDEGQAIHTGEILKALKGNNVSGSDATSILPLYGLIEGAEDPKAAVNPPPPSSRSHAKGRTSGFWRSTKLGRAFALDKVKVPERIVTCLGVPEAFEGDPISIKEALGKKFNYDEIMGRKTAQ